MLANGLEEPPETRYDVLASAFSFAHFAAPAGPRAFASRRFSNPRITACNNSLLPSFVLDASSFRSSSSNRRAHGNSCSSKVTATAGRAMPFCASFKRVCANRDRPQAYGQRAGRPPRPQRAAADGWQHSDPCSGLHYLRHWQRRSSGLHRHGISVRHDYETPHRRTPMEPRGDSFPGDRNSRAIRFRVGGSVRRAGMGALWEVSVDGTNLHALLPPGGLTPPQECCGKWSVS